MKDRLIVHDRRVKGMFGLSNWPDLYMVNESTPLQECIGHVAYRAKMAGGIQGLEILAHGYSSKVSGDGRASRQTPALGYGIQLCKEGLDFKTVGLTAAWKGLVKRIVIHSCGVARTDPANQNTAADGRRFCGEIALWTGAEVIASEASQDYKGNAPALISLLRGGIDLGKWEGKVYRFDPQTGQGAEIKPK